MFVDRYDRRSVMLASNLGQGIVVAIIPFLIGVDVALLFVALLINAGVKQFFDPAYEALIPEIASDDELTAANAFLQIASFGSTAIGFAAAGLIASAYSISWAFWIDALTFLFSAACIFFLRVRSKPEGADEETSVSVVVTNLKLGIRTIVDTPMLRNLFLLGAPVFFAFGLWNVLLLPMAIRELGATEFEYGVQEALTSVGFVVGSLFMAKYADLLQTGLWVFVGTLGMGISGVFYGLSPTIGIAIVWVMLSGFFNSPSAVARQTLLQRHTPRELRGRVFSALFVMRDVIFLARHGGRRPRRHHRRPDHDHLRVADPVRRRRGRRCSSRASGGRRPNGGVASRRCVRRRRATSARTGRGPARDRGRLRPPGRPRWRRSPRLNDTQRAAFLARCQVREVAGRRPGRSPRATQATAAYFILEGEAAAGIPERRRRLSRPVDDGRGRLLRRDRRR